MSIIDVAISRAKAQDDYSKETYTGVVQATSQDQYGNIVAADVLIDGHAVPLRNVYNSTGVRISTGLAVTVNYIRGNRHNPQVVGGTGASNASVSGAAAATASGTASSPASPTQGGIAQDPVLLYGPDNDFPQGAVVEQGCNISLAVFPAQETEDGFTNPILVISSVIAQYYSIPGPAASGLYPGTIIELMSYTTGPNGLLRLVGSGAGDEGNYWQPVASYIPFDYSGVPVHNSPLQWDQILGEYYPGTPLQFFICGLLASINITLSGTQDVDGIETSSQYEVLCVSQTDTAENGPWVSNPSGSWSRPLWYRTGATVYMNMFVFILQGVDYAGTAWQGSPFEDIIVGTTGTIWSRWGGNLLQPSGVTPGSYTDLDATIDKYGRVTAASDGVGGATAIVAKIPQPYRILTVLSANTSPTDIPDKTWFDTTNSPKSDLSVRDPSRSFVKSTAGMAEWGRIGITNPTSSPITVPITLTGVDNSVNLFWNGSSFYTDNLFDGVTGTASFVVEAGQSAVFEYIYYDANDADVAAIIGLGLNTSWLLMQLGNPFESLGLLLYDAGYSGYDPPSTTGSAGQLMICRFIGDGSTTSFALPGLPCGDVPVTVDGVPQDPTSEYTVSGMSLMMTTAPVSGAIGLALVFVSNMQAMYVDRFVGDGTTTAFALRRTPTGACSVTVDGVPQDPNGEYTVSGPWLSVTDAPAIGALGLAVYVS